LKVFLASADFLSLLLIASNLASSLSSLGCSLIAFSLSALKPFFLTSSSLVINALPLLLNSFLIVMLQILLIVGFYF